MLIAASKPENEASVKTLNKIIAFLGRTFSGETTPSFSRLQKLVFLQLDNNLCQDYTFTYQLFWYRLFGFILWLNGFILQCFIFSPRLPYRFY